MHFREWSMTVTDLIYLVFKELCGLTHCHLRNMAIIFNVIFRNSFMIDVLNTSSKIALMWISQHLTDYKSTLVQVMTWWRHVAIHCLDQCQQRVMWNLINYFLKYATSCKEKCVNIPGKISCDFRSAVDCNKLCLSLTGVMKITNELYFIALWNVS